MAKRADEAKRHDGENADVKRIDRADVIAEQFECDIVVIDHPGFVEREAERLAAICDRKIGCGAQCRVGLFRMRVEDSHQPAVRIDAVAGFVERVLDFHQADHAGRAVRRFGERDRQRRGVPIIVGHDGIEPLAHAVRRDQQDEQQARGRQQVEHAAAPQRRLIAVCVFMVANRPSASRRLTTAAAHAARSFSRGRATRRPFLSARRDCTRFSRRPDKAFERGRSARRAPRYSCSVRSA